MQTIQQNTYYINLTVCCVAVAEYRIVHNKILGQVHKLTHLPKNFIVYTAPWYLRLKELLETPMRGVSVRPIHGGEIANSVIVEFAQEFLHVQFNIAREFFVFPHVFQVIWCF